MMPMVAATLVAASSTGMPAAISAPNASSISTSVTGRLKPSAAERSSATRSLIASSRVRSPAWRISRRGGRAGRRRSRRRAAPASSWSARAGRDQHRRLVGVPLRVRHRVDPVDGRAAPARTSRGCRVRGCARPGRRRACGDQDVLGVGRVEAGLVDHGVGAAGLAEPVVGVGRLAGGDGHRRGRPRRRRGRARRGSRARGGWRSSARRASGPGSGLGMDMTGSFGRGGSTAPAS